MQVSVYVFELGVEIGRHDGTPDNVLASIWRDFCSHTNKSNESTLEQWASQIRKKPMEPPLTGLLSLLGATSESALAIILVLQFSEDDGYPLSVHIHYIETASGEYSNKYLCEIYNAINSQATGKQLRVD